MRKLHILYNVVIDSLLLHSFQTFRLSFLQLSYCTSGTRLKLESRITSATRNCPAYSEPTHSMKFFPPLKLFFPLYYLIVHQHRFLLLPRLLFTGSSSPLMYQCEYPDSRLLRQSRADKQVVCANRGICEAETGKPLSSCGLPSSSRRLPG